MPNPSAAAPARRRSFDGKVILGALTVRNARRMFGAPVDGAVIDLQKEAVMDAANGIERWTDLGDATMETGQVSPTPPFYVDGAFGMGSRPNSENDPP